MNLPGVSPLTLEILMHYHVSGAPYLRAGHSACKEVIDWLRADGLLRPDAGPSGYALTPRGKAWMTAILATPTPPKFQTFAEWFMDRNDTSFSDSAPAHVLNSIDEYVEDALAYRARLENDYAPNPYRRGPQ